MHNDSIFESLTPVFCSLETWSPKQVFGPGQRPHYIFNIVMKGKGILQMGNEIFHLNEGDTFFLKPDAFYYLEADEYTPWQLGWVAFAGEEAANSLLMDRYKDSPVWIPKEPGGQLFYYMLHLIDVFEKSCSNQIEIYGAAIQLFSYLMPKQKKKRAETKELYLSMAKEYINRNYCYDIKIQDIAKQIGIDRSYVYRLFMEMEHLAPKDYLLSCRLKKAYDMLLSKRYSVTEAAYSCGFADADSLSYHFQNAYEISLEEFMWQLHQS